MKGKNARVTVEQHHNAKFDSSLPVGDQNEEFIYWVVQTHNTLHPPLNRFVSATEVRKLIQSGVSVMVVAPKGS